MSQPVAERLRLIDLVKAVAAQLIILHHLAFYGPMADHAAPLAPALTVWLAEYGRFAVQAFLVVAGFLAARGLAPHGIPRVAQPLHAIGARYVRLAVPYLAALVLAIGAAAVARAWMLHDSIPGPADPAQLLAHVFLLHGLLGYESLSAGLWYVAIDFQLFALLVLLLSVSDRRPMAIGVVVVLGAASLLVFNRHPEWDATALYFFGSYALGVGAYWASMLPRRHALPLVAILATIGAAALALEFRGRIGVSLAVAFTLLAAARSGWMTRWPDSRSIAFLARISYSVFLVHFPVCLVVNAAWERYLPHAAPVQALGILVAWALSVWAGWLLYEHVERRAATLPARVAARVRGTVAALRGAR